MWQVSTALGNSELAHQQAVDAVPAAAVARDQAAAQAAVEVAAAHQQTMEAAAVAAAAREQAVETTVQFRPHWCTYLHRHQSDLWQHADVAMVRRLQRRLQGIKSRWRLLPWPPRRASRLWRARCGPFPDSATSSTNILNSGSPLTPQRYAGCSGGCRASRVDGGCC